MRSPEEKAAVWFAEACALLLASRGWSVVGKTKKGHPMWSPPKGFKRNSARTCDLPDVATGPAIVAQLAADRAAFG